ncbi:FAD binding domain-containing protein [Phyllosticta citrichinensis]|uniref:FAD binding domain-containing protein n=1 Tax=Phyllosticta citrichinensis TaxID=1130410 RepID=A0ABR1XGK6_9PEZI
MGSISVEVPELETQRAELQSKLAPKLSPGATISFPSSEEFESSNLRFTEYERPTYFAAVKPTCENDVIETVRFATSRKIGFSVRSGHHCVTTTMRKLQNGILIDMRPLNHMTFDTEKQQATVGGGVITDDFAQFLQGVGMEVTVGSCPTTGVIGVAFGAGLGRLQGKYGYLNDNMVSCKLLLADGSVVLASQESHSDLFWAIRGAGHNFAIALEATFKVYPQENGGLHHTWDLEYKLEQCEEVFETLNRVHETMPPELSIFVLWRRESAGGHKTQHLILVNLVWSGQDDAAAPWVQKFEALNPVLNSGKVSTTWAELPWTTYGGQNKALSRPEVWKHAPYKAMGAVSVENFDLKTTRAFFESVKEMNEKWVGKGWFGAMFECLPHHRTRQFSDDYSAFPWRWGTNHHLMMTATPVSMEDREAFENHLDQWKRTFIKVSGYGRPQQYVNYGNTTSTMQDPPEALYGYEPWRLEKLRALKRLYDPDNVFCWYQPLL